MEFKPIIDRILAGKLHEAFVLCWHYFTSDFPRFQKTEKHALESPSEYHQLQEMLAKRLLENEKLKLLNLPIDFPLALLEVLDRYLFERFNRSGNLPTPMITAGGQYFYVYRRRIGYQSTPPHRLQTGHPRSWLTFHQIVPCFVDGISIKIHRLSQAHMLPKVQIEKGGVPLFIGCFPDDIRPNWYDSAPGAKVAEALTDPDARWESIRQGLEYAANLKATIVVFPELTICPALRRKVSDWLLDHPDTTFSFVLPGSFHQKNEDRLYNIAELFSGSGKSILSHTKITSSGFKDQREGNDPGDCINLLDTPIGLVGIPICLDFCEEGKPFNHLWEELGADWLLVPAFGDDKNLHAHQRRADALKRSHGTVCAVANQNMDGQDKDHGFISCLNGSPVENTGKWVCVVVPFKKTLEK